MADGLVVQEDELAGLAVGVHLDLRHVKLRLENFTLVVKRNHAQRCGELHAGFECAV